MSKSRYDYEKQHEQDVLRIEELTSTVNELERKYSFINEKMNDMNYLVSLLVNELRRTNQAEPPPKSDEHSAGRRPKLTDNVIQIIKMHRDEGHSQKDIAEMMGISVGLVNKACNTPS